MYKYTDNNKQYLAVLLQSCCNKIHLIVVGMIPIKHLMQLGYVTIYKDRLDLHGHPQYSSDYYYYYNEFDSSILYVMFAYFALLSS